MLAPDAVGLLLEFLGFLAFNGLAHTEGRGALAGRLGERVTAPAINLADSPRFARTLPRAFDAEGVPKAPLPLIQDGVAHAVVHDTRSAARAGARSTGHALAPGGAAYGPVPTHLVLTGGGAADEDELLRARRARDLRDPSVVRQRRPREARPCSPGPRATAPSSSRTVVIGRPLKDVRFTDSVLRLLASTEALTAAQRLVSEAEFYGRSPPAVVAPALRASAFSDHGADA